MRETEPFRPEFLFFAAFFSTLPFYSPNITFFHDAFENADSLLGTYVQIVLLAGIAAGMFATILA